MSFNNKCSKCGEPATHKFTRISNGQIHDLFLCQQHAAENSPYQKQNNLSEILEGLLKHDLKFKASPGAASPPSGLRCKACGLAFETYRKNFMLGCSDCYTAFRDLLMQDLRKFHGDVRHVGRRPGGGRVILPPDEAARPLSPSERQASVAAPPALSRQRIQAMLDELEQKLNLALQSEDFEKAAQYRDLIKETRQKTQRQADPSPQP